MKTEIEWLDPKASHPPFGVQILVILGGIGSKDCMRTSTPYVHIANAVIARETPNCEGYSDYHDFLKGEAPWDDFQFYVVPFDQYEYGDPSDCDDWYSDAIVAWAPMPDFSALLAKKQAEAV